MNDYHNGQQPADDVAPDVPVHNDLLVLLAQLSEIETAAKALSIEDRIRLSRLLTAAGHAVGLTCKEPRT